LSLSWIATLLAGMFARTAQTPAPPEQPRPTERVGMRISEMAEAMHGRERSQPFLNPFHMPHYPPGRLELSPDLPHLHISLNDICLGSRRIVRRYQTI
jgi:hypothetical protein